MARFTALVEAPIGSGALTVVIDRSPHDLYPVPPLEFHHTSLTAGRLFEIEKTENIDEIFVNILREFRQRYLLSYTPRGVAPEGWHKLDVRVKRGAVVKARPGYQS